MPLPTPVAILGFSTFDRKALGAFFKLTEPGRPRYEWVLSMEDATLVIADADESGVHDLLCKLDRVGDTLFIGAQAPTGATAWMMRPIDRTQVLRELDRLRAGRDHPRPAPMPLPLPASLGRALRTIGSAPGRDTPGRRAGDDQEVSLAGAPLRSALEDLRRQREALRQPQIPTRVLLVDDSEVALHFLRRQLEAYGLDVDLARHSDRALDLLTHHAYGIVFLDVDLGEHSRSDGLTLCHQIRHRLLHPGGKPPMVVMVSAFHDPVDQVRGTLAGAEGYLGKPLDSLALDRLLQHQGFQRRRHLGAAPLLSSRHEPG
jgi:CheY-like chemotaxis protein